MPEPPRRAGVAPEGSPAWVRWALAIALAVGALLRLFPDLFEVPPIQYDAHEYDKAARQILQTGSYSSTFREPLFPYFLALSYWLLGDDQLTQLRFMGLLSILSMVLGIAAMRRVLPARALWLAVIVVAFWAVDGDHLNALRELYSVALQGLLLAAAALCLIVGVQRHSVWWCVATGVLIGLMGLSRGAWAALSLPAAACALQGPRRGRLLRAAVIPAFAALLIVPWMVRQQRVHGFFAPAASSGMHLFIRAWHLHPKGEQGRLVRERAEANRNLYPESNGQTLSQKLEWIVYAELGAAGVSAAVIDREFKAASFESLRANPLGYVKETLSMVSHVLGGYDFTWFSMSYFMQMRREIGLHLAEGSWLMLMAELLFRLLLPAASLVALLGGLWVCVRQRDAARVVLLVIALSVVALLSLFGSIMGVRRYRSELNVVIFPAIAVGAWSLAEHARRARDLRGAG